MDFASSIFFHLRRAKHEVDLDVARCTFRTRNVGPDRDDFVDTARLTLQKRLTAKMKTKTRLPRRQFLASSALAACALLAPRIYGASRTPSAPPTTNAWNADDQGVIAELAAYSSEVYLWKGPENFDPRAQDVERIERSVKYLVRVADFRRLVVFLNSKDLSRLGEVYAGGPNLAFVVGTTAYIITNYGPEDFYRATN